MNTLDLDNIDIFILQTLQQDGRTSFTEIAKQVGVSETTVRNRYQSLSEKGIIRAVGVVDPSALGFEAPALINIKVKPGEIEETAKRIAALPEVSYLVTTLGAFDLNVEVLCRDLSHLTELLTRRIHTIPGILNTEVSPIAHTYKLSYKWSPDFDQEE
jgi:Lrp/AsnC family transcriptional regulator, regulator for asnA, asnC and gidA